MPVLLSEITLGNRNRWLLRSDRISFSESISVNLMNLSLCRNFVLQFYSYNRHLMISLSAITFRESKRSLSSLEWIRFNELISLNLSLCQSSKSDKYLGLNFYSYSRRLMISLSETTFRGSKRSLVIDQNQLSLSVSINLSLCCSSKSDRNLGLQNFCDSKHLIKGVIWRC